MANTEVGSAYLTIIPSMKGFGSKVSSGVSSELKSIAGGLAKSFAVATAASATAVAAIGKQALDAYADYEQLVGGMDTLFKDSSGTMKAYAAEAYKTAQMSANEYMELSTSFAASLISSLGGDTAAAAEYANKAMGDMADNVNKMGSNAEDVQQVYSSLSRGIYTTLDNLKLGYGGTKSEMERLIADANKVKQANGEMADLSIDSFADVVEAIHTIQQEMGITGTTAEEASTTIQGSVAMSKAAWENWLTGLGSDTANMTVLTSQLVESVATAAGNIIPRLGTILATIIASLPGAFAQFSAAFQKHIPELVEQVKTKFANIIPPEMQVTAAKFAESFKSIAPAIASVAAAFATLKGYSSITSMFGKIDNAAKIAKTGFNQLKTSAGDLKAGFELAGEGIGKAASSIGSFGGSIVSKLTSYFGEVGEAISYPFTAIASNIGAYFAPVGEAFSQAFSSLGGFITTGLTTAGSGITSTLGTFFEPVTSFVSTALEPLKTALSGVFSGFSQTFGVLAEFISPIALIGTAIAALAAGFIYMYTTNEQFRTSVQGIIEQIVTALQPAFVALQPLIAQIGEAFTQFMAVITGTVLPIFGNLSLTILQFVADCLPVFTTAVQALVPIVQSAFELIGSVVSTVMAAIQGVINTVMAAVSGDWSSVWENIKSLASTVWDGIKNIITNAVNLVYNVISGALSLVNSIWSSAWSAVTNLVSNAWSSVTSVVSNGASGVINTASGIPSGIVGALGNLGGLLYNAGSSLINGLYRGIKNAIVGVYNFVAGIASRIAALKGPISYDKKVLIPNGAALMQSLKTGLEDSVGDVYNFVSDIAGEVSDRLVSETQMALDTSSLLDSPTLTRNEQLTQAITATDERETYGGALGEIVGLLGGILDKDSNVYMDTNKVSAALASASKTATLGSGMAW